MKKFTFLISLLFCLSVYSQQIEWAKEMFAFSVKSHFTNNEFCLVGFTQNDTVKIDTSIYSWNTNSRSFIASLKKDGSVDTAFPLSNFVPIDFTRENNGYFIAGWGPFSFCMSKSELNSNISWSECYYSQAPYNNQSTYYPMDEASSLIEHKNSLYAVGHYEDSLYFGNQWMYGGNSLLAKINPASGNISWAKNIPYVSKIIDLQNESFLIGHNLSGNALFDSIPVQLNSTGIIVSCTDTMGNFISAKVIAERAWMADMATDSSKNIFITGNFNDSCKLGTSPYIGKSGGFFLLKTDTAGSLLWSKVFFSSQYGGDKPFSLSITPDNSVFLSGIFYSDTLNFQDTILIKIGNGQNAFLAKFSSTGQFNFARSLHATYNCDNNEVTTDDEGSAYWSGWFAGQMQIENQIFQSSTYNYSSYLIKISGDNMTGIKNIKKQNILLYPNPSSGIFTINLEKAVTTKICVRDILGNCLLDKEFQNEVTTAIDLTGRSKGVYFIEIISGDERAVKKIILE